MNIKLSNVKGALIILVVFAHLLEINKLPFLNLFVFIYSFHMPLFVFLSGYFSKNANLSKVFRMGLTLLIFQFFFVLLIKYSGFQEVTKLKAMTIPIFHLWYLLSMIVWYLIVIGVKKIKNQTIFNLTIITLIVIGVISRFFTEDFAKLLLIPEATGYTLGFQRTLSYLPFFLIGYVLPKQIMNKLSEHKSLLTSTISVAIIYLGYKLSNLEGIERLYRGSFGFDNIYMNESINRVEMLIISYLIVPMIGLAIFVLIPNGNHLLTKLGINSMGVFLFHVIVVIMTSVYFKETISSLNEYYQLIIWLILPAVTCVVFGSNWFNKLIKKIKLV